MCALLQENMALITSIRENMVMGRFLDNHSLMLTFDKNVKEVTALLATLPFAEMQKLPVQVIILVCVCVRRDKFSRVCWCGVGGCMVTRATCTGVVLLLGPGRRLVMEQGWLC